MIDQPSPEDTVSILRGLKLRYELHHGVRIRDKAIDLVDEACAKLKNELTSKPTVLDEIDRRIIQLEMERLSLRSDVKGEVLGGEATERLRKLDTELTTLQLEP